MLTGTNKSKRSFFRRAERTFKCITCWRNRMEPKRPHEAPWLSNAVVSTVLNISTEREVRRTLHTGFSKSPYKQKAPVGTWATAHRRQIPVQKAMDGSSLAWLLHTESAALTRTTTLTTMPLELSAWSMITSPGRKLKSELRGIVC